MLAVTKVLVVAQIHRLLRVKTTESLSSAQLVRSGHLVSTLGAHMAIVFNSVNDYGNTVDLSKVALGNLNLFLLAAVVVVFDLLLFTFFLFLISRLFGFGLFLFLFTFLLVEGRLGISREESLARVNELVLFGHGLSETGHRVELEIGRAAQSPVKLLGGELVLALECNGECDVVVGVQARNLAPEAHLIRVDAPTQLAQCHLELHSKQTTTLVKVIPLLLTSRQG